MTKWTTIKLKGKSQVMPRICPNCMGEASHSFRYAYKGLKGFLTNTTYYQSFNYCEPCMKQASSALGLKMWTFWLVILSFILWIVFSITFADAFRPEGGGPVPDSKMALVTILAIAASLAVGGSLLSLVRFIKRKRYPAQPNQAVWGPAVYYVGSGILDVQNVSVYKAVRREWLKLLLEANPEQVDEATYAAFVGAAKPAPTTARPFGGD